MTKIKYSNKAKLCLHCGNETIMEIKSEFMETEHEFENDEYGRKFPVASFYTRYILYKCPSCHKITLITIEASDVDIGPYGKPFEYTNTLYPVQTGELSFVPEKIRKAYESSLKTKNVDNVMCVIGLRRTLEIMCRDQGENKGNLYDKLKKLSEKGIIPQVLDEASQVIRIIGNSAAHEDIEFDDHVVKDMIKFTRIILEYVYVIPTELKRIQSHVTK